MGIHIPGSSVALLGRIILGKSIFSTAMSYSSEMPGQGAHGDLVMPGNAGAEQSAARASWQKGARPPAAGKGRRKASG